MSQEKSLLEQAPVELTVTRVDTDSVAYAVSPANLLITLVKTDQGFDQALAVAVNTGLDGNDTFDYAFKQALDSTLAWQNKAFNATVVWLYNEIGRRKDFFVPVNGDHFTPQDMILMVDSLAGMNELDSFDESDTVKTPKGFTLSFDEIQNTFEFFTNVDERMTTPEYLFEWA